MRPAGLAAVDRAKADGTWESAYAGSASIELPPDLAEALASVPAAQAAFERLNRRNRYAVLYRISKGRRSPRRTSPPGRTICIHAGARGNDLPTERFRGQRKTGDRARPEPRGAQLAGRER